MRIINGLHHSISHKNINPFQPSKTFFGYSIFIISSNKADGILQNHNMKFFIHILDSISNSKFKTFTKNLGNEWCSINFCFFNPYQYFLDLLRPSKISTWNICLQHHLQQCPTMKINYLLIYEKKFFPTIKYMKLRSAESYEHHF